MSIRTLSRRQLLLGASGFSLGLPWMKSLLPRELEAAPTPTERRFVAFATNHGGIFETAMYPSDDLFSEDMGLYTGHSVRRGALQADPVAGETRLSEILRGDSSRLTPELLSKMNVLRGLDIPFYIAHHTGGHLGNYARNDGNGSDGQAAQMSQMPTIDQLMAWSDGFYSDLAGIRERSLVFGSERLSYNWTNPSARTGGIQEISGEDDPLTVFNQVFVPEEDPNEPAPRPPIVDKVFESYQSLRQSDRRLSSLDRQRLDDHMDRLAELERKLHAGGVRRASCGSSPAPSGDREVASEYYSMINDVIAAAFLCGTSRIAVVKVRETNFTEYAGDWHQEIAHQWSSPDPQARLQEVNQMVFEHVLLDLAHKLNVEEAPDCNVLDSSLLQWTQESGEETHDSRSLPVVTFGGAGGRIQTGNYCDYRRRTQEGIVSAWGQEKGYSGLVYSQWLAQVLQAMGVSREEFEDIEHNGQAGYGLGFSDDNYSAVQLPEVLSGASSDLPFLGA